MAGFHIDKDAVGRQRDRVDDLGADTARAASYARADIRVTGGGLLLAALAPAVNHVRETVVGAIQASGRYLDDSAGGLTAGLKTYHGTDVAAQARIDATYPKAGPRPKWTGKDTVPDTRPGPTTDEDRKKWDEYESQAQLDNGPGNPQPAPLPPPGPSVPAPMPTNSPQPSPPGPTAPATPRPSPGPAPTQPTAPPTSSPTPTGRPR